MAKIKAIFWLADHAGCGYARLKLPAKYLMKNYPDLFDIEISQVMNPKSWIEQEANIVKPKYQLTVHQRQYGTPNLQNMKFLKDKLKVPCIYEIDDFLHGVHKLSSARHAYDPNTQKERFENIDRYLRESSALTVTTDFLKKTYSKYNNNIYVLPNYIDFELYNDQILISREMHRQQHKKDGEIWLGWAGSNTHLPDLNIAKDAVIQILKDFSNVKLALGGWDGTFKDKEGNLVTTQLNPWKDIPENRKVAIPWATEIKDYPNMLVNFDIGIAPLEDNEFNRCKSNIKYLEYSACGVPVIASEVEPYSKTIESGKNGLLVQTKGAIFADWYKKIKTLVVNEQLRLELAKNANLFVRDKFNIAKEIYRWKDTYLEIINR